MRILVDMNALFTFILLFVLLNIFTDAFLISITTIAFLCCVSFSLSTYACKKSAGQNLLGVRRSLFFERDKHVCLLLGSCQTWNSLLLLHPSEVFLTVDLVNLEHQTQPSKVWWKQHNHNQLFWLCSSGWMENINFLSCLCYFYYFRIQKKWNCWIKSFIPTAQTKWFQ